MTKVASKRGWEKKWEGKNSTAESLSEESTKTSGCEPGKVKLSKKASIDPKLSCTLIEGN